MGADLKIRDELGYSGVDIREFGVEDTAPQ